MSKKKQNIIYNQWIDCNLPYYVYPETISEPEFTDEEIIQQFGKVNCKDEDKYIDPRRKWDAIFYANSIDPFDFDKFIELSNNDPDIIWICEEDKLRDKIDNWKREHPKTKKYNKDKKKAEKEALSKSFIGLGINIAGLVVDALFFEYGSDEIVDQKIILFGDCDENGSVCGDFHLFDRNVIVRRYKILNYKE